MGKSHFPAVFATFPVGKCPCPTGLASFPTGHGDFPRGHGHFPTVLACFAARWGHDPWEDRGRAEGIPCSLTFLHPNVEQKLTGQPRQLSTEISTCASSC